MLHHLARQRSRAARDRAGHAGKALALHAGEDKRVTIMMQVTSAASAERRLVEGAQLARMQGLALIAQDVERGEADLEMLADGAVVEAYWRRPAA